MTWPIPFHKGARSPLYLKQISSPCIRRISTKEGKMLLERSPMNNHPHHRTLAVLSYSPGQLLRHCCCSPGIKKTRQTTQSSCRYLNQSLAKWSKQFSSCSSPGPIWLWCYLGSNGEEQASVMFLKSCSTTTTVLTALYFSTMEKHKTNATV